MRAEICIGAQSASFEISEVQRGMAVGWEQGLLFGLNYHAGMELALGAAFLPKARPSLDWSMLSSPMQRVIDPAVGWARHILSLPQPVVRANIDLVRLVVPSPPATLEAKAQTYNEKFRRSPDSLEGLVSFLEQRPPNLIKLVKLLLR